MNIDKIILKLFNKSNSLEELEILESWKRESEQNIAFLNMMDTDPSASGYSDFDTDKAWNKLEGQMESEITSKKYSWMKYAAFILIAFIGTGYFLDLNSDKAYPHYESKEEVKSFELNDKSKIWLNKNSILEQINNFEETREVALNGEAFFDVSHDPNVPFMVNIGDEEFVKVVGTSFNIINDAEQFDLRVYSGKVELHALDRVIVLEKNDRVSKLNGAYVKLKHKDLNHLSWRSNELIFENEALEKVFEELEKHYNIEIKYSENIDFTNCSLRSRFVDQSLDEVLKEFERLFSIKYKLNGNEILIEELNCF